MTTIIQTLIIATTPALRAGLRAMLDAPDILIIDVLAAPIQLHGPSDVIVLSDASLLPELGRMLNEEFMPGILLLSDNVQPARELGSMALRGWGILLRESEPEELQAALRAIAQGLVVMPKALVKSMSEPQPLTFAFEQSSESLTTRELEVLTLLGQGLTNRQLAIQLSISEHTVKFHISAILTKLGASSRTDAVSRALRQGLISL